MRTPASDVRLHGIFFTGLALAGAGCSTYKSARPDSTPTRTVTASGAITDPVAIELAKQYRSADPQGALPGLELVGLVEDPGLVNSQPTCSKMPCDAEWLKLAEMGGRRVVIMRRSGKLEALTALNFKEVLGPLDTPEKVALRMQVEDSYPPATCGRLSMQGLACAEGSNEDHVPVRAVEGGFEVVTFALRNVCENHAHGAAITLGVLKVAADGEFSGAESELGKAAAAQVRPEVACTSPSRGRMFEGFEHAPLERCELEYHLRAAREEAAAVVAFERLARELRAHGAPDDLVQAASRSAADERRHARLFRREALRVARALGVELLPAQEQVAPLATRPLHQVLVENAREGCANETYAALVATYQASHAPTARLRALLSSIAADEREHAILAHRIHAWGHAMLDGAEKAELTRVFDEACARMFSAGSTPLANAMGEPRVEVARLAFQVVVTALAA